MVAAAPAAAIPASSHDATEESGELDMHEYLFGHIGDSYGWHVTTINGHHVTIPLPVIVHGKSGWHVFSSSKLAHGESYKGFRVAEDGEKYAGKVVEQVGSDIVKPFDISITKNVFGLMVNSLVLVILVLLGARWYKKHDAREEAPKGFAGIVEMMVMMVEEDIIKDCVGKDYKRYSPYLLTAFFFIFINNLMGIVPFFPGGANITGNIAITLFLAVCTFLAVNLFGNKHYYKDIIWPEVPSWLKVPLPIMPLIEIIGVFTKPFSLMIRLFANILAGHIMILGVVAVIFLTAKMGIAMNAGLSVIAVAFGIFLDVLELLVAFLQAYVFTMLSSVFIGLSRQEPEAE
ncbi:MAG: F0F1 ATP synthase subunit A [Bacteroidales bacterium]|nr:F0F1 ATP synthase subunit A [Bacteroidales bacterium]